MTASPATFRFAPSPNGHLHLGHAFSALVNADAARAFGGRMLVRIEDIDLARCRPEFETAILEDLSWLGVAWEQPVRRQSEHFENYRAALAQLRQRGLIYPSFESRAEIAALVAEREAERPWPRDPDGVSLYPGTARLLSETERQRRIADGAPFAWRLDMAAARQEVGDLTWAEEDFAADIRRARDVATIMAEPEAWGDVIVARKDVPTSYHLAVVVDDALQGVSHVMRGEDLFAATAVHRLLQALLGLPEPRYNHHRLIRDAQDRKLSKSTDATALRALREDGVTPANIRERLGLPVA